MEPVTEVARAPVEVERDWDSEESEEPEEPEPAPVAPKKIELPTDHSLGSLLQWFTLAEEARKAQEEAGQS
uniref:Uncharacterized protein n=1 Tax=Caenorhabditis japonica TaxID=281687 RepID=A0A8R1I3F2_CAEJA